MKIVVALESEYKEERKQEQQLLNKVKQEIIAKMIKHFDGDEQKTLSWYLSPQFFLWRITRILYFE